VESVLTTLVSNSPLTSFKIDGRGDNTVVILRFTAGQHVNMATQHYRTKPPSQLARDRRRAEQRKEHLNQVGAFYTSPSSLFHPNPSAKDSNLGVFDMPSDIPTDIGLLNVNKAGRTFQRDAASKGARATHGDIKQSAERDADVVSTDQLFVSEAQALDQETNIASDTDDSDDNSAEPPPGTKEYVGSIKDRALLRRLKDKRRNKAFRKTVIDKTHSDRLLLCDADDIVVMYNCSKKQVHHWFVKQPSPKLIAVERECLVSLEKQESLDNGLNECDVSEATKQLLFLRSVISHLLG
jgi:hypothetical protein